MKLKKMQGKALKPVLTKVKSLTSPRIPKSIFTFFISILFCYGYDFGFTDMAKPKLRLPMKFFGYVLFVVSFLSFSIPIKYGDPEMYWSLLYLIKYTGHNFVLFFCKSYTVHNFFFDMCAISKNTGISLKRSSCAFFAIFYGVVGCRSINCVVNCAVSDSCQFRLGISSYWYCIANPGLEIMPGVQTLIFCIMYTLLKSLKNSLEHKTSNSDIIKLLKYYIDIADCYEKIKPFYDFTAMVDLFFIVPKYMIIVWQLLFFIQEVEDWIVWASMTWMVFSELVHICVPTVMVELTKGQVDAFVLLAEHKLSTEEDEKRHASLLRLLRYVRARPLHHKVWRCVPIDMQKTMWLLSECTTYIIVILQFQHFYD